MLLLCWEREKSQFDRGGQSGSEGRRGVVRRCAKLRQGHRESEPPEFDEAKVSRTKRANTACKNWFFFSLSSVFSSVRSFRNDHKKKYMAVILILLGCFCSFCLHPSSSSWNFRGFAFVEGKLKLESHYSDLFFVCCFVYLTMLEFISFLNELDGFFKNFFFSPLRRSVWL
jgi:hypothetical protein